MKHILFESKNEYRDWVAKNQSYYKENSLIAIKYPFGTDYYIAHCGVDDKTYWDLWDRFKFRAGCFYTKNQLEYVVKYLNI